MDSGACLMCVPVCAALRAVRVDDSGLSVSGHMRTTLDCDGLLHAVAERSQFPDLTRCRFVRWTAVVRHLWMRVVLSRVGML
jgi:hypothetical protein